MAFTQPAISAGVELWPSATADGTEYQSSRFMMDDFNQSFLKRIGHPVLRFN